MNAAQKTQWIAGCENQIAGLLDGFEWDLANDGECFEETGDILRSLAGEAFSAPCMAAVSCSFWMNPWAPWWQGS